MLRKENITEGEINLIATEEECAALSKRFGLECIERLEANALILNGAISTDKNIRLDISITALVIQKCVATLAPIRNQIKSSFIFELGAANPNNTGGEGGDDNFDYNEVDFANVDIDTGFNLGELISQYLGLEIDPFPRCEIDSEEVSSYLHEPSPEEKNHPFSVLKDFKRN